MVSPVSPSRVLVVDDEEQQRSALASIILARGFAVETAADGEEALKKLASFSPDVLLTDLMMPRMDGFELLRRKSAEGDLTPAIVLTGFGSIDQAISIVHDLKAFWFLEKPVQPNLLATLLGREIRHNRMGTET